MFDFILYFYLYFNKVLLRNKESMLFFEVFFGVIFLSITIQNGIIFGVIGDKSDHLCKSYGFCLIWINNIQK